MIVACGFVEVDGVHNVEQIVDELRRRQLNIDEVEAEKILFLMERDTVDCVRREIKSLKDVEAVRNVHLTYYSFENGAGKP